MKISDIGKDPTTLIYLQSMGFRTCNAIGRVTSGKPTQEPLCQTISGTMLKKNRPMSRPQGLHGALQHKMGPDGMAMKRSQKTMCIHV